MINKMKREIYRIYKHYGLKQLDIAQEELAELIQAISKFKRYGDASNIEEEIADVEVMLDQVRLACGCKDNSIEAIKRYKVYRQLKRIQKEKHSN